MNKVIRIGTRDSELALWQANDVKKKLDKLGYSTQLIPVKSDGDLELNQPLYSMGITGIFTKTLDVAMLADKIDVTAFLAWFVENYPGSAKIMKENPDYQQNSKLQIAQISTVFFKQLSNFNT